MKKLSHLSILFLTLAFFTAGCGGESDTNGQAEGEMTAQGQESSSQMDSDSDARTIDVIGIDKLKFVVAEQSDDLQTGEEVTVDGTTYYTLEGIMAQAGEDITINLKTISQLPAQAMSHNWLLLVMGADAEAFNKASLQAKDNDYIAPDMEDQVITDTGLVANGESASASFTVPDETGDYDYICTFPGHFASMQGTLTVD
jgi:azurin